MRAGAAAAAFGLLLGAAEVRRPLEDFENISSWRAAPADGVALELSSVPGVAGNALRMDFDFGGRGGYAAARRPIELALPENYEISFSLRGRGGSNTMEIKFADASGENVWWIRRPDFTPPQDWTRLSFKKRHVRFAWGPLSQREGGSPELTRAAYLEFVVAAAEGGAGHLEIDELVLTPLPADRPYAGTPAAKAEVSEPGGDAARAVDGRDETSWRSGPAEAARLEVDFGERRELGGLTILWEPGRRARRYELSASTDGQEWTPLRAIEEGGGSRDELFLPETDARWLRLALAAPEGSRGFGIAEIRVRPLAAGESINAFLQEIARDLPRGAYPRGFSGEQVYWTVAGLDGDSEEVLVSEDGAIEPGERSFSIEPFLLTDGKLWSWADVRAAQSLEEGHLPIPTVAWGGAPLALEVTVVVDGAPGVAIARARYRVSNPSQDRRTGKLFLAIRPLLVNPPTQFLNVGGGAVRIEAISGSPTAVEVDGRRIRVETPAAAFGAAPFEAGPLTEILARGDVPRSTRVEDSFGYASAALAWDVDLPPGSSREILLAVPLSKSVPQGDAAPPPGRPFEAALAAAAGSWREASEGVSLMLGGSRDLVDTLRANLAAILVNRDGPAIQPGSRAYARSWIRDGALTSTALLRLGHFEEVREFLLWYAPFQYPDGKVPCCVDRRGADPVPENDSHGELLYLAAEYLIYTGDLETARRVWPHALRAVGYMDALRGSRRTSEYRSEQKRAYFGLLPESISHEGYSAKPVHSYWDQIWALKGYEAAVLLAQRLGETEAARRFAASRDQFRGDLKDSLARVIAAHRLSYIPGSVELADYDATSTTIALAPWSCRQILPEAALRGTFERYLAEFETRRGSQSWDAYTPYEWRTVGALVRLGRRDEIPGILEFFLGHRRPAGWRHWAEVVGRDVRHPRFIGDMPHTWVGSDFIRSLLDMLAWEREDGALVLAAGVPTAWAEDTEGVGVRGLRTPWGVLDYRLRRVDGALTLTVGGDLRPPPGGVVLAWPFPEGAKATIDGKPAAVRDGEFLIRSLPATVRIR
jgi:hypothetical protein